MVSNLGESEPLYGLDIRKGATSIPGLTNLRSLAIIVGLSFQIWLLIKTISPTTKRERNFIFRPINY
uniref:Uncharacterized protein n=1 Tax=Kalanchoe fedtschenkoi TaxID=63787 RepID=A0A7N0TRP1_KALFE